MPAQQHLLRASTRFAAVAAVSPLFVRNFAAGVIFWVTLYCWNAVEWRVPLRDRRRRRAAGESHDPSEATTSAGAAHADRGTAVLVAALLFVGLAAGLGCAFSLPATRWPGTPWIPLIVGAALVWAGLIFRAWAVRALGRSFTATVQVRAGQPVVTTGPYRLIRHPSYTGALVSLTGIGLALGTWPSLIVVLGCSLSAYLRRITVEEQALCTGLGDQYIAYSSKTWRLVPYLW